MLVLLLTMRTWYKERVGAAGAGRNRRRLGRRRAAVRQEEGRGAESSHRCRVPGARVGRRGSSRWSHRPFDQAPRQIIDLARRKWLGRLSWHGSVRSRLLDDNVVDVDERINHQDYVFDSRIQFHTCIVPVFEWERAVYIFVIT